MYFYASHLGNGIYGSEEEIDEEYLYCETCGDADFCIGVANNREELKNLLKEHDFYCNNYILDKFFPIPLAENEYISLENLKVGEKIKDIRQISRIFDTYILLSVPTKKNKGFEIYYFGSELNEKIDDIISKKNVYLYYNPKNEETFKFRYKDLNSHNVNSRIKGHILEDAKMREIGFWGTYYPNSEHEQYCPYWYFTRYINFISKEHKNVEISFKVQIPKDGSDIHIDVLDEDFCQPYDYQMMLEDNPYNEIALIVYRQVEMWMGYLQRKGVLSGHREGEYI